MEVFFDAYCIHVCMLLLSYMYMYMYMYMCHYCKCFLIASYAYIWTSTTVLFHTFTRLLFLNDATVYTAFISNGMESFL